MFMTTLITINNDDLEIVTSQVRDKVLNCVFFKLCPQVHITIWNLAYYQTLDQIENQTWDRVGDQIYANITREIYDSLRTK